MQGYRETKAGEIQSYKVSTAATPVAGANDIEPKRIVLQAAAGTINYAAAGTVPLVGVTLQGGDIGVLLDVQSSGIAIITSGAAVAINTQITATTGGKGIVAAATDFIIGYARSVATAADQDLVVQLEPGSAD